MPGGDDLEVVERALAPTQELVALTVALVLEVDVALERIGLAEDVEDDRVVDDHVGRGERVDLVRVTAEGGHCLAHGRQVDDAGHSGEILHDDAGRGELDFDTRVGGRVPRRNRANMVGGDVGTVLGAKEVLREDLQCVGQLLGAGQGGEAEDLVGVLSDLEGALCTERIITGGHFSSTRLEAHRRQGCVDG